MLLLVQAQRNQDNRPEFLHAFVNRNRSTMGNSKSKKSKGQGRLKKDDSSSSVVPPQIAKLAKKTNFSTTDLQKLFEEFTVIAAQSNNDPNELTKDQFLDVLDKHQIDWRSDVFVEDLFDAIGHRDASCW